MFMQRSRYSALLQLFLAITCFAWVTTSARASHHAYKMGANQVRVDLPSNWKAVPEIFGLELAFVGPMLRGSRPSLSITDLGLAGASLQEKDPQDQAREYAEGRKRWLQKKGGRAISFDDPQKVQWSKNVQVHSMGVRYEIAGVEVVERSYTFFCKKSAYHVKTLLHAAVEREHEATVLKVVQSLKCL